MDNFLYCYLSPFLVGLVAVVAVILGGLALIILAFIIGEAVGDRYSAYMWDHDKLRGGIKSATEPIGKAVKIIIGSLIAAMFILLFSFLFWEVGIDILKRIVCR